MTAARPQAALLTPAGRGALAVIRVIAMSPTWSEQLDGVFQARGGRCWRQISWRRVVFGRWGERDPEDVVLVRTDESSCEISCHGGQAAAARILTDLTAIGCDVVTASNLMQQATNRLHAELCEALSQALTWRTAEILLDQCSGTFAAAINDLQQWLDSPDSSRCEHRLADMLRWSRFGQHLTQPWSVVLTGRPNVGKSSLINALLGYTRAIVFDQPGTTRDVVTARTAFDGWPVELADTAGLRDATEDLEAAGIARARTQVARADLVLLVLDTSEAATPTDLALLTEWPDALVIAHKADQPNVWNEELPPSAIAVSSLTGQGLAELQAAIVQRLVPDVPPLGTAIPVTRRQTLLLEQARDALLRQDLNAYQHALAQLG